MACLFIFSLNPELCLLCTSQVRTGSTQAIVQGMISNS